MGFGGFYHNSHGISLRWSDDKPWDLGWREYWTPQASDIQRAETIQHLCVGEHISTEVYDHLTEVNGWLLVPLVPLVCW